MKMCQPHWDQLRAAIDARGMGHLGAKDSTGALERAQAEVEGTATDKTFDPLMAANFGIFNNALRAGGMYLMQQDENGNEYCPLCELEKHNHAVKAADWIREASDEQLRYCKTHKLVPDVPLA
jgi:hypothetical protein